MIGNIAFAFINSAWGRYIAIGFAALAALSFYGRRKRKQGREEQHEAQVEFVEERTEDGKEAFHQARRENAERGVSALIARMRARDSDWAKLPRLR